MIWIQNKEIDAMKSCNNVLLQVVIWIYLCCRKEPDGKFYVKYQVIGANHVAVPTHFYKVVVGETPDGKFEMESYVMPNQVISDDTPLANFQVYIQTI